MCKVCQFDPVNHLLSLCAGASCCVNAGGGNKIIFGKGTKLIIQPSKCLLYNMNINF